mgnify:CR=1 FL=1
MELINSKVAAKLMRKTAKECGMTRLGSYTDLISWAEYKRLGNSRDYRRIAKRYDFLAENFIELLEAKIKAEGFDLADCKVSTTLSLNISRVMVDQMAEVEKDPEYIEAKAVSERLYEKFSTEYLERRPYLQGIAPEYFRIRETAFDPHYFFGFEREVSYEDLYKSDNKEKYRMVERAQNDLYKMWEKLQPKIRERFSHVFPSGKSGITFGDTYVRLTAALKEVL